MRRYTRRTLMREVLLILVAIIWMIPFYFLVIVAVKPDIEALQTPLIVSRRASPRELQHRLERRLARPLAPEQPAHHRRERHRADRDRLDLRVRDRAPARAKLSTDALLPVRPRDHPPVPARPRADLRRRCATSGSSASYIGIILLYTGIWMPFAVFLYTGFVRGAPEGVRGGVAGRRRRPRCGRSGRSSSRCCGR